MKILRTRFYLSSTYKSIFVTKILVFLNLVETQGLKWRVINILIMERSNFSITRWHTLVLLWEITPAFKPNSKYNRVTRQLLSNVSTVEVALKC
jgi:hypothetical protein